MLRDRLRAQSAFSRGPRQHLEQQPGIPLGVLHGAGLRQTGQHIAGLLRCDGAKQAQRRRRGSPRRLGKFPQSAPDGLCLPGGELTSQDLVVQLVARPGQVGCVVPGSEQPAQEHEVQGRPRLITGNLHVAGLRPAHVTRECPRGPGDDPGRVARFVGQRNSERVAQRLAPVFETFQQIHEPLPRVACDEYHPGRCGPVTQVHEQPGEVSRAALLRVVQHDQEMRFHLCQPGQLRIPLVGGVRHETGPPAVPPQRRAQLDREPGSARPTCTGHDGQRQVPTVSCLGCTRPVDEGRQLVAIGEGHDSRAGVDQLQRTPLDARGRLQAARFEHRDARWCVNRAVVVAPQVVGSPPRARILHFQSGDDPPDPLSTQHPLMLKDVIPPFRSWLSRVVRNEHPESTPPGSRQADPTPAPRTPTRGFDTTSSFVAGRLNRLHYFQAG